MPDRPIDDQLVKYLTDAHSIEEQALAQMRAAPDLAGDPQLAEAFRAHLAETERHEQLVRERLDALGASPARLKDVAGAVSGKAFVLFARSQPDTTGKLVTHGLSYEHAKSCVRLSLSIESTEQEVGLFLQAFSELVAAHVAAPAHRLEKA